jgi:hypothetical protein
MDSSTTTPVRCRQRLRLQNRQGPSPSPNVLPRAPNLLPPPRRGSDEGGQYSFHDFTSRFARNPRLRLSAPKIPFIGECTLNDTGRIQPSLTPSAGPIRRCHGDYCGATRLFAQPVLDESAVVSSTSKLCHYGSPQMAPVPAPPVEILAPTKPDGPELAFCRGEITAPIAIAALTQ